ncbi:MAG: NAD-dependent epimerase/dehydratase family protein, partial [Sphingobacteriales bacterium]
FPKEFFEKSAFNGQIDTIIHAGAFTPKNGSAANDIEQCNTNIFSLEKLLQSNIPGLKRIIYLSTLDVYGADNVLSESSPLLPVSLYGHSKLYGEKMIETWAGNNGIKHQILRIGHVYGPGEEQYQKIIPVTMGKLLHKQPIEIWGDGSELRAFIYIDDVVRAIIKSIEITDEPGPVNIVSGNTISLIDLVKLIIEISGGKAAINYLDRKGDPRDLTFNTDLVRKHLLLEETKLSDGLRAEWEHMKGLD